MGSDWRMPTIEEIRELINNTTPTFIDLQGNEYSKEQAQNNDISEGNLKGVKLTGSNGNSIFIPADGNCEEFLLYNLGSSGEFWSSSLNEDYSTDGRYLIFFYIGGLGVNHCVRYYGLSVRGVKP